MSEREEFEGWVRETAEAHEYSFMDQILKRNGDDYATTWVDSAWMGWQASRAHGGEAAILRKQADAVENEADQWIGVEGVFTAITVEKEIRDYAVMLRAKADKLDAEK